MTREKILVLLVEDEEPHIELIRRVFAAHAERMSLITAHGVRQARARIADSVPDLVIADLVLPDGKGTELLPEDGDGACYPVVVMTSHGDERVAVEAMKAGALHYVVKSAMAFADLPQVAETTLREWSHIIERQRAEEALQESEKRYRALYDDNPSMFFTVDAAGTVLSANNFAAEQLGYSVEELVGKPLLKLHPAADRETGRRHIEQCFQKPEILHRWEICKQRRDTSRIWVRVTARIVADVDGRPSALIVCEDVTEARQLSDQLSYQASHDPLTGLVNRREFERRLERTIHQARGEQAEHALCYLDLDQFKVINDTCGHVAGDELLRQVGGVLHHGIRKRDTLARLGGDEFGVLIKHCAPENARKVAEGLRKAVAELRFLWESTSFKIGVSIGLVAINDLSEDGTALMAAADSACYAAKDQGRDRVHVYHADDTELARRQGEMQWVSRIHSALEENQFYLTYQPIAPIQNGNGAGTHYELLLRMMDENQKLILPGAFLPAAERYNLIHQLDHWVAGTAFRWLAEHRGHLDRLHLCSINLSGHSLGDRKFLEFITVELGRRDIPAEKICFEITETAAISNLPSATRFIKELRKLGCRFALDDFGSGLSSFAYLKNLPVDFLKIDGLFVKDIVDDPIDLAVVRSINEIGHVMGKRTIAEFVENEAILDKIRAIGIDYAQGYHIGHPQPIAEMK